uniref:Uncharacterized protein n=1 Tax=Tanacetum cinerariifolium TaxID=118510 RepID=A0A6L2K9M3_TANCI|nr:hypothetical protein [Tanacetum cinerariifolium]
MNQNFYNSNSSGFDQTQPSQFPVIHPPPQETNIEILHDQENVINSVQTFLRKFNRYSFFETPKVLLLAWDRVFEIKDAFGNNQYKSEDIQELFRKLLNDVQNIHEELAEYINTSGWNHPTFYNNGDDDEVDYTITITPVLSSEEPDNSQIMGDEHLDSIPATESDEVIKSSVEDLVPIPSESEGILDTMCDVHFVNNPTPLEAKDHFEIVINSNDDISSSDDDSLYNENIDGSTTTHSDISLWDYEALYLYDKHIEEISSGSTTTHSDISLFEYDSFIFDLSNDQFPPTDRSNFTHEEFAEELAHIIYPPKYDCFYFRNLPDPSEWISILNSRIRENPSSTTRVNLPVEDDHSPLLAYVVWILLAYLTYLVIPPYLHSFKNEDTIFDPGIAINRFYSFKPGLSYRCRPFKKFNTHRSHLKFNRYSFFETPKVLLLAWNRVFEIKDAFGNKQYKSEDIQELFRKLLNDVQNIHEELADDDDSLYNENIEYVEASPHDSELVSFEIEALKDNPTPSSEFLTKSSSIFPKSFLEETNTFDKSLPEFENFCFDLEEISSGSTTTHSDISLSEYDSFIFDLSNDQFPPTDRSNFTHEKFTDELAHIISPLKYDCLYFRNFPDPGEWISILNFEFHENTSSTTSVNLPVEDDHSPLLAYVVWILLAYLTYPVIRPYLHLFGNEDTIFDSGITINRFYSFKPGLSHRCKTFKKFNTHRSHLNESLMELLFSICFPMDQ